MATKPTEQAMNPELQKVEGMTQYHNDSHYVVLEQGERILPDHKVNLPEPPMSKYLKRV